MTKTVLTLLMAVTPQTRATISRALRPADFEIVWTVNASEAIEMSARRHPDLVLLDLAGPLQNESGILERLRIANPNAPVVVLTEHKSAFTEAISESAGAVLQKPVGAGTLSDAVNSLLKLPRAGGAPDSNAERVNGVVMAQSERFRETLRRRATTPFEYAIPHPRWGINE